PTFLALLGWIASKTAAHSPWAISIRTDGWQSYSRIVTARNCDISKTRLPICPPRFPSVLQGKRAIVTRWEPGSRWRPPLADSVGLYGSDRASSLNIRRNGFSCWAMRNRRLELGVDSL